MFQNITLTNTIKTFVKKSFGFHLQLEVARLTNPSMNNFSTLNNVKGLDYITRGLRIPSSTNNNAIGQVNLSIQSDNRRTRQRMRSRRY
jgi:hypothetical protein